MKNQSYDYPLNTDWSTSEIITVMRLYEAVETAYERAIQKERFLADYRAFKQIVRSKSEEKQLDQAFGKATGYSIYRTVQQCLSAKEGAQIQMKK